MVYNQQLPFTQDDCMLPRTLKEAFGKDAVLEVEEDSRHEMAIIITFILVGFLALLLWYFPNAKAEAPNISHQAPNISHIHCAHIHRHVCGMDGCRMVDIKHLCWRAV